MPPIASPVRLASRPRVQESIDAAASHPVILILAPAGFGKTVALQQYLARLEHAPARFDVRPEHASLLEFVRGIAQAVRAFAPDAADAAISAVHDALAWPEPMAILATWMARHLESYQGTVAIDDLHHADADPRACAFLRVLIERTVPRICWVIAARSAVHLPVSTWLVNGIADLPIDERVLKFTADEAHETSRAIQSNLANHDVDQLLRLTSGWATAFSLAIRLLNTDATVAEAASRARHLSYDYLAEHVYQSLSDEERELLLFGSILPSLEIDVLEKAGFARCGEVLNQLYRRAAFLSLDAESGAAASPQGYRLHDLFRDFLANQLELRGEQTLRSTRYRAAKALAEANRLAAALRLYVAGPSPEEILDLLQRGFFQLVPGIRHVETIRAALDILPPAVAKHHPSAVAARAVLEYSAERYSRAEGMLKRAIELSESDVVKAYLLQLLSKIYANRGEHERSPAVLQSILELDHALESQRVDAASMLAFVQALTGQRDEARNRLDGLEQAANAIDSEQDRVHHLMTIAITATIAGEHERATRLLATARSLFGEKAAVGLRCMFYSASVLLAISGESSIIDALNLCAIETDLAAKSGFLYQQRGALVHKMVLHIQTGDEAALVSAVAAFSQLPSTEDMSTKGIFLQARAFLYAWRGEFHKAHPHLIDGAVFSYPPERRLVYQAFCALLEIATDLKVDATKRLAAVASEVTSIEEGIGHRNAHRARALCAIGLALLGKPLDARRLIPELRLENDPGTQSLREAALEAVRGAQDGFVVDAFASAFEKMRASHLGGYARFLERIIELRQGVAEISALTPAEMGVLRGLAEGQAPKDIAALNGTSINTVRVHIRRIIAKLGCSGRDQAIRIARGRGLI